MQKHYQAFSILLSYPEQAWLSSLAEIKQHLAEHLDNTIPLEPLFNMLEQGELIELQENYVHLFDRTAANSLHLFEHIHGEERTRGQALVNLLQEYEQLGFTLSTKELPDYLPLFLELLSLVPASKAEYLLGEAIHVIAHIRKQIDNSGSPYAALFKMLEESSPVTAQPLTVAPIKTMEEALITFGPDYSGAEPLLKGTDCIQHQLCSPCPINPGQQKDTL